MNEYLDKFPAFNTSNEQRFKNLQQKWEDTYKDGYTLPSGATASPLELLSKMATDVKSIPYTRRGSR
jgi:hypothetical protein